MLVARPFNTESDGTLLITGYTEGETVMATLTFKANPPVPYTYAFTISPVVGRLVSSVSLKTDSTWSNFTVTFTNVPRGTNEYFIYVSNPVGLTVSRMKLIVTKNCKFNF